MDDCTKRNKERKKLSTISRLPYDEKKNVIFFIMKSRKVFREETIFWMCNKNEMDIGKLKKDRRVFFFLPMEFYYVPIWTKEDFNRDRKRFLLEMVK